MANPQRFCDCLTGLAEATESWQPNRRQAVNRESKLAARVTALKTSRAVTIHCLTPARLAPPYGRTGWPPSCDVSTSSSHCSTSFQTSAFSDWLCRAPGTRIRRFGPARATNTRRE